MTIKLPVSVAAVEAGPDTLEWYVADADGHAVDLYETVDALNAAPDLTALVEAARLALDWLGPTEASRALTPGSGLSEDDRCRAERNVLRAMLTDALVLFPQDGDA